MPGISKRRIGLIAALGLLLTVVGVAFSVERIRWRIEVIALRATGDIEGITWSELLTMLRPGSPHYLQPLVEIPNPYAVIRNPYTSEDDQYEGAQLYVTNCAPCHGESGEGGNIAPALVDRLYKFGDSDWAIYRTISDGLPELGMPELGLPDREAWQISTHLRSLRVAAAQTAPDGDATHHRFPPTLAVPSERILKSHQEPENWLTYSGSYRGWRHSALSDISVDNVADLKLAWSMQFRTDEPVEVSPIVVDGIMYLTAPPSSIFAVDAVSGEQLWEYSRPIGSELIFCCGHVNRGVAVLGERVYAGTIDAAVVALDARTGQVIWETQVADSSDSYTITSAPLIVDDMVITGIAGGEFGIRGFLDAYDAETGELRWRFNTIPGPDEPGAETWGGDDAWPTGGGPTWVTGSYDPELGLVYWGVGNPSPEFNGDVRPGDNLYTDSVIALDVATGELAWHYQFTPHDEHDWDSTQVPVLVDHEVDGVMRKLMLWANRNGFYYVLDRTTGEFINARAFVKQTWAESIDPDGRPIPAENTAPTSLGNLVWPGAAGGTNWWSPSYSPRTDFFYVSFLEGPAVYFKDDDIEALERQAGRWFLGSTYTPYNNEPYQGGVRALDPITGERRWEYLSLTPRLISPRMGGILTTAGDVLFVGDFTTFLAFDARNGQELWRTNLGGDINAGPISFMAGGRQMVSIPSGNTFYVFTL